MEIVCTTINCIIQISKIVIGKDKVHINTQICITQLKGEKKKYIPVLDKGNYWLLNKSILLSHNTSLVGQK